jgi:hypothetical protein
MRSCCYCGRMHDAWWRRYCDALPCQDRARKDMESEIHEATEGLREELRASFAELKRSER